MQLKVILAIIFSIPVWFLSFFNSNKISSQSNNTLQHNLTSFYTLSELSIDGQTISMDKYKNKKVIVLNVASKCGYTSQYADWQAFYEKNKDKVVVLGFPCNQFMAQEPGTAADIETFCQKNYGVTFPMFAKIDVKGEHQCSVYKWLTDLSQNGWNSNVPAWNFNKYLIDENGRLTYFFGSKIRPDSPEFLEALK
ncbi:MAG: glutathione peroxidase [Saprospiraceae bacterium]|nr:glutathione peroxidase [Saprospiraceae bacterium]